MEMLDKRNRRFLRSYAPRNYGSNESADSVNALIQFKEKIKNLYKLEETAANEFDKQIFKIMNKNKK
jgi:L-cysteine desulfidase